MPTHKNSRLSAAANIVICTKREDPFARIPKTILDDKRLSWRCKGILSYLLGKPAGWKVRRGDLANHGTEGDFAIRSALKELRKAGYAELVRLTDGAGLVTEWVWKVSDSPIFASPDVGKPHVDKPHVDKPHVGNQHLSKKESTKTELTKNESKETEESKGTSSIEDVSFPSLWKPISGTKAEQLKRIEVDFYFPSESEFDSFVEAEGLDHIGMGKGGEIYHRLCVQKWQHWNGRRWYPIRDWEAYVKALDAKMQDATTGGF